MSDLSNEELIKKVHAWVTLLCRTGAKAWSLSIPARANEDPDLLITELAIRFEAKQKEAVLFAHWLALNGYQSSSTPLGVLYNKGGAPYTVEALYTIFFESLQK